MSEYKVGIDLGTTYSCIAVIDPATKNPVIVKNYEEEETTPSVVLYKPDTDEFIVGKDAKDNREFYPDTCYESIKRHMGEDGFILNVNGESMTPQHISSKILIKIISDFKEFYNDYDMESVTITCPAYFNNVQKEATKQAGTLAGFKNVHILEEPIAASLSYAEKTQASNQTIFVYDLGGGTFDVTVLKIEDGIYSVKGVGGDSKLGGKDWDKELEGLILEKIIEECPSLDQSEIETDPAYPKIVSKVEDIKKKLSKQTSVKYMFTIGVNSVEIEVSREEFEQRTAGLLEQTKTYIDTLMNELGITFDDIDRFLLVGGSTKMPQVRDMLNRDYPQLSGKIISHDPNLAVAAGAAIYESMQESSAGGLITDTFKRVLSHTYGIEAYDGGKGRSIIVNIANRNEELPLSLQKTFYPAEDNQTVASLKVYMNEMLRPENEDDNFMEVDECTIIGTFELSLAPDTKRNEMISVTIEADNDTNLIAICEFRGEINKFPVTYMSSTILTDEELEDAKYRLN